MTQVFQHYAHTSVFTFSFNQIPLLTYQLGWYGEVYPRNALNHINGSRKLFIFLFSFDKRVSKTVYDTEMKLGTKIGIYDRSCKSTMTACITYCSPLYSITVTMVLCGDNVWLVWWKMCMSKQSQCCVYVDMACITCIYSLPVCIQV